MTDTGEMWEALMEGLECRGPEEVDDPTDVAAEMAREDDLDAATAAALVRGFEQWDRHGRHERLLEYAGRVKEDWEAAMKEKWAGEQDEERDGGAEEWNGECRELVVGNLAPNVIVEILVGTFEQIGEVDGR